MEHQFEPQEHHSQSNHLLNCIMERHTSRPGAISTKTPYGAIDLISQFLSTEGEDRLPVRFIKVYIIGSTRHIAQASYIQHTEDTRD